MVTNEVLLGVDYDWEYPGAGDRGGHKEDGQNFVSLVEDTRAYFRGLARGWGISFTAPSSYWYMRHFEIGAMMVRPSPTSLPRGR
jgi:chitinase